MEKKDQERVITRKEKQKKIKDDMYINYCNFIIDKIKDMDDIDDTGDDSDVNYDYKNEKFMTFVEFLRTILVPSLIYITSEQSDEVIEKVEKCTEKVDEFLKELKNYIRGMRKLKYKENETQTDEDSKSDLENK
jgi:hypothetical protein